MTHPSAASAIAALRRLGTPARAAASRRFFKTGPGQYGEGDVFIGVTVPQIRRVANTFRDLPLPRLRVLLTHRVHECRLLALLILVSQFHRARHETVRRRLHAFYLRQAAHVNNWDLVDCSAEHLVGGYLDGRHRRLLDRLARSHNVWERRIAMIATFHDIKRGRFAPAYRIAERLLSDHHDLIHKAVGWMLREAGKRGDLQGLHRFLTRHAARMPRTALRYAIERFPPHARRTYLRLPASAPL